MVARISTASIQAKFERLLGPEARESVDQLQQIMRELEEAGYVQRRKTVGS